MQSKSISDRYFLEKSMKPNRFLCLTTMLLLVVLSPIASFAQFQMSPQQRELADYIKSHYTKREVMIPMRDGVKLFACIYEPKDKKQKYPIMFDRTPYSVGAFGGGKKQKVPSARAQGVAGGGT